MRAAQPQRYDLHRARERAGAVGLTLTVYALMLAILAIFGGGPLVRRKAEEALNTILIAPPKQPATPPPHQPPSRRTGGSPKLLKITPEPALKPDITAPAAIKPIVDLPKMDYALEGPASTASGADKAAGAGSGTGGTGTGTGSQSGSGGVVLYQAQWQKMNTAEELHRKVPRNAPSSGGWGEIACRSAPNFRVTDCKLWGESPKGSGYGQAVLGIADVFRVKPPLVDGKPLIGAWVLIHIGYYNSRPPLY